MPQTRKIIHIDMDAFFAAVEQRDFPEYRNKPLIVGGSPDSRGVVATCSYAARKYGIHSAMPASRAYRLCPDAIFVKPRFEAYREASERIREVFNQYSPLVEPLSLDEAFLDVSAADQSDHLQGSATLIAKAIKSDILKKTELVASAGISYNKFLAKIASDMDKPDGLYLITPDQGPEFVESLPIGRFHGVGKATENKMHKLNIFTGRDLKQLPLTSLQQYFGKSGQYFYNIARGIDYRPVISHRARKSIGVETTFQHDIEKPSEINRHLEDLLNKALFKLSIKQLISRTLTVKIKYHDFTQITRSRTLLTPITRDLAVNDLFPTLLKSTDIGRRKVRLLGVSLSTLEQPDSENHSQQMDLFKTIISGS